MNIAITGASGFLGKALVKDLATTEHHLTLLGRNSAKLRGAFDDPALRLIETDYSFEHLCSTLGPCDVLVHLAARRYEKHLTSIADYCENMFFTENLLKACSSLGCRRLILASTCSVYTNRTNRLPFSESDYVQPLNPYAISKVAAEHLGFMHCHGFVGLRFAQLLGLAERRGFMLMTFIEKALSHEPLLVFGNGLGTRDYLHVRDAVKAIVQAIGKPDVSGLFNIGSGVETSHYELAQMAQSVFSDGQSEIVFDRSVPVDTSRSQLDITKARNVLDWAPRYDLKQAFQEMKAEHHIRLQRGA